MTSRRTTAKLAALGFAYDETVTFRDAVWHEWSGTIDPIGRRYVAHEGVCMGHHVSGSTRAEMDREAIEYARIASPQLTDCTDADCEMHSTAQPDDEGQEA